MAATACLYNLSKAELGLKVHPACLREIVDLTLLAMMNFPNHQQLQKNALLTLCSDRILQDVVSYFHPIFSIKFKTRQFQWCFIEVGKMLANVSFFPCQCYLLVKTAIYWKILANTVILVILANTGHTGQLSLPTWKTNNNQTVNILTLILYLLFKYFSSAFQLLLDC